jgi:glycosyltransferase involved in cell wall biosynthesis
MFGGNFDVCKNASKSNNDRFWNAIFLANAIFLETKFLVSFFEKMINEKTKLKWTPNVRQNIYKTKPVRSFSKKFVFISQIKKTKGIDEILEVVNTLPAEYTIDIYGPIVEDRYNEVFKRSKNYYGNLNPSQVITVLNNYDVLLLPTYYNGEGYPGIIIEAFSLGIPVITTNWKSIPEIVTNGENGILINIQDTTALKKAILQIDNKLYEKISFNAYKTFSENFDSERINSEIVHLLINS